FFNFTKKNKKHQTKEDNFNSLESKKINFSWLHDITESDCSIVVSSHKTILCVSQDGNIYHDDPNKNINPLLIYQVTDGVWFLRKNNLSELDALITDVIKEYFKFSSKETPILV
ncbi:MAG: hypothetical protein ABF572_10155, partial [Gluconobacter sp.]|uniref:hypothetical protein n=1 Tax=Gluconobacter sp. TaxID=1876758 RepID=UPI0039ED0A32